MSSRFAFAGTGKAASSWASHIRATLALGIPLIGAQLAQLGIHTTDVVIVGQLGAQSLAAMVLSGQFFFTIFIFGSGFSIAVVPMVAQAFGRGDVVCSPGDPHGHVGVDRLHASDRAAVLQCRDDPSRARTETGGRSARRQLRDDRAVRPFAGPSLCRAAFACQRDRPSGDHPLCHGRRAPDERGLPFAGAISACRGSA
jgi:hypothetical protein